MKRNGAFWATGTKCVYVKKEDKKKRGKKGRGINGTSNRARISRDLCEDDACVTSTKLCARLISSRGDTLISVEVFRKIPSNKMAFKTLKCHRNFNAV